MVKVIFRSQSGEEQSVDAQAGDSIMQTAVSHGIMGILGECGGSLACATCHVYVDEVWLDKLDPRAELEDIMLEGAASPPQKNSRLSCQLVLTNELDGIVVTLPDTQL